MRIKSKNAKTILACKVALGVICLCLFIKINNSSDIKILSSSTKDLVYAVSKQLSLDTTTLVPPWLQNLSKPLCTPSQVMKGQWVPEVRDSPPYVSTAATRCAWKKGDPWIHYEWQPFDDDCEFTGWNEKMFCDVLKHAVILILGDSLTLEFYHNLIEGVGVFTHGKLQFLTMHGKRQAVQAICNGTTHVSFRRNDDLKALPEAINETFPTVIILNRGAHYVDDETLLQDLTKTFETVQRWQEDCKRLGLKCHFVWRTTTPGHPYCQNYTEPVNNLTAMEELVALERNNGKDFHWQDIKRQNERVVDLLQTSGIKHELMDSYYLLILRPDRHRKPIGADDCLHSCHPGKTDVYLQLLLHILRQKHTLDDVERLSLVDYPWRRRENVMRSPDGKMQFIPEE